MSRGNAAVAAAITVGALIGAALPSATAERHYPAPVKLIPPQVVTRSAPPIAGRDFLRPTLVLPVPPTPLTGRPITGPHSESPRAGQAAPTSPSALPVHSVATRSPAASISVGKPALAVGPSDWAPWLRIAACESSGHWNDNTGNGYYGGLQEDMNFWRSYGARHIDTTTGKPVLDYARPDLAPEAAQITAATRARDGGRGYKPWPVCGARA